MNIQNCWSLYFVTDDRKDLNIIKNDVQAAIAGGASAIQLRLKHPNISKTQFQSLAGELLELTKPSMIPLIINDDVECAKIIGADGVHLGQKDMSPKHARAHLEENPQPISQFAQHLPIKDLRLAEHNPPSKAPRHAEHKSSSKAPRHAEHNPPSKAPRHAERSEASPSPTKILGWSLESIVPIDFELLPFCDYVAASPVFSTHTKQDIATPWGIEGLRKLRRLIQKPLIGIGGINIDNIETVLAAGADGVAVISAISRASDLEKATRQLRTKINDFFGKLKT